jgi:hypothetical protein
MRRLALIVAVSLTSAALLAGCGGEETYSVGLSDEAGMATAASEGFIEDVPIVEVKTTTLPDAWPTNIPIPPGARIDNVITMGDETTVTWLFPEAKPIDLVSEYIEALKKAGYESGESEATEFYGKGIYWNDTHAVDFTFTPVDGEMQLYLVYGPKSESLDSGG